MRVHHLNCATLCPPSARLVNGAGSVFGAGTLVCHCLLIETDADGLILVDSGLGTGDLADPKRLSAAFRRSTRPALLEAETAISQVRALGFEPADVRHIVVTHLDLDHAGGVGDFPAATLHVHRTERAAVPHDRQRYVPEQFASHERWSEYDDGEGDSWFGLAALRPLAGVRAELGLVPLAGHSRGHSGVVVREGEGWLLAAGDAYFHRDELGEAGAPFGLRMFARLASVDDKLRRANVARLATLRRDHADAVQIFCAHDPVEFATAAQR